MTQVSSSSRRLSSFALLCLLALVSFTQLWAQQWTDTIYSPSRVVFGGGEARVLQQTYTISGSVKKATDGSAVGASVCVFTTKSASDNEYFIVYKAATDATGSYSLSLPSGAKYKFVCYPWDNSLIEQYYSNADRLETATSITLGSNRDNINFSLQSKPVYQNGIRGQVIDANGAIVSAVLFAHEINSPNSQQYSVSTDKNTGNFLFENLRPGEYIVRAAPQDNVHSDGYYRMNDFVDPDANKASSITVKASGINTPGISVVVGEKKVVAQQFGVKGIIMDVDNLPIEGVQLSLYDINGKIIPSKILSDKSGLFYLAFDGVAGTYSLILQKQGYSDARASFVVDEKMPYVALSIVMFSEKQIQYDNAVKGIVVDKKSNPILAKVSILALQADGSVSWNTRQQSVETDALTGEYVFKNLRPGSYVIYATAGVAGIGSGYYVGGKVATQDSKSATVIVVEEKGINAKPYVVMLGESQIVSNYDFYAYIIDEEKNPVSGASFSISDANGNDILVNQLNMSDDNGYFHCTFPSAGVYTLRISKDGYQEAVGTLSFFGAASAQKALIIIGKMDGQKAKEVGIIANVGDETEHLCSLYPQPVSSTLTISLKSGTELSQYRIYDVNGSLMLESNIMNSSSAIRADVSSLPPGTYALRLFSNDVLKDSRVFVKN